MRGRPRLPGAAEAAGGGSTCEGTGSSGTYKGIGGTPPSGRGGTGLDILRAPDAGRGTLDTRTAGGNIPSIGTGTVSAAARRRVGRRVGRRDLNSLTNSCVSPRV